MNSSDEELDEVSTLSEQLNQSMLHSSATIQEVLMQNNFLQDFSQRLLARYNKERQRCSQLESALNLAQVTLERTQVLLQTSEAKVAALRISTKEFTEAIEAIEVCILQRIEGQLATAAKEKLGKFSELGQKVAAEREYYKTQFEGMMESAMVTVRCRNCRKAFIPKTNSPSACTYHPGKLHYYSCFGCGDDAYYTCCNRCSACSPGCRTGSHFGP